MLIGAAVDERDWGASLRMDAQALHDDLVANHPGAVNSEDPDFVRRNDEQLRLALARAETARTLSAYFFALRAYVAAFDDGHLNVGMFGSTQSEMNWPGFLTRYGADNEQSVIVREDDAPVPVGARLLSCDGRSASQLARENVGQFFGRWSLMSQRLALGSNVFVDFGIPYVRRPTICRFEIAARIEEVTLSWRSIAPSDLRTWVSQMSPAPSHGTSRRVLADGTRWISIASFDGSPQSAAGQALPLLIELMHAERAALAAAPAIVLDLRGNGGGSSDWARQIAELLWGRSALERLPPTETQVDWRVSATNLAVIQARRAEMVAGGAPSPAMRHWYDQVTSGLEAALARGETLWRQPMNATPAEAESTTADPAPALNGPVYLVTDASCMSACLDAVDLWRGLGAIHVGQTTGADTLYMEIRTQRLPSGLGLFVVPMKVYRGRARGANEPVVPVHAFSGDISDTQALERWIAGLPERRR